MGSRDVTIAEVAETVRELVGGVPVVQGAGRAVDYGGAPVSGARAERELGWTPSTPLREGIRRYVEWDRAARAPARASAWRPALSTLVRRAALAALMAAVVSSTVLGLALLVPIDGDMDRFDTFTAMLAILLPLVLATAFEWDGERARLVRAACWIWVAAALVPLVAPWPAALQRLGHAHFFLLSLLALSGGVAALAAEGAPWLSTLRPAAGDP